MSDINDTSTTSADPGAVTGTGTGDDGQNQAKESIRGGQESLLQKARKSLTKVSGGSPVGWVGIVLATAFLIGLIVVLLWGITNEWPVCDLQDENRNANVSEGSNANANRSAPPTRNDNSSSTPGANASVATTTNANAPANTYANAPANSNASAGTQTNTNASTNANVRSPGPGASPSPTSNETTTKLDADSIEPASGPISGKTLITIKGKNFGSKKEDIVVKFGESEAKVDQISDKSLSVSTPRHSEGLVDVTVAKGAESDVLTSAYTYTCPPPSGRGLFLMLVMAGALGGCVHALRSLFWYSGQGELKWRWMPMYFALPFTGAAMAMLFSLLMIAGVVDSNQPAGRSAALFIIAIAGLVGMFSQQAALKLTDVANAFFTKPGEGKDAKPQASLSVGQSQTKPFPLVATVMSPNKGNATGGEEVKITGSGFNTSTTVSFGGTGAKIKSFDSTSITVVTPAGKGEVEVEVKSGDQSVKLPAKFTYT